MAGWPYLAESWCPWCERVIDRPRLLRLHDDGAEYECTYCTGKHTRKEGVEDEVFIFFPADIAAMSADPDLKPLFPAPWWQRWARLAAAIAARMVAVAWGWLRGLFGRR